LVFLSDLYGIFYTQSVIVAKSTRVGYAHESDCSVEYTSPILLRKQSRHRFSYQRILTEALYPQSDCSFCRPSPNSARCTTTASGSKLAAEGLLRESGREREGNRPTRQLYEITAEGRRALAALRREGLSEVWFKYDPFDLALTRSDPEALDMLPSMLSERLATLRALLAESCLLSPSSY